MFPPRVMIGICAYNEENNIATLLQNLVSKQHIPKESQILVVCSGCTDRTPQIVTDFKKKDARVKPLIESARKGKSNAVNEIFKAAKDSADILVLVNADALPEKGSIAKLVSKLMSDDVGAVFAQPVPMKTSHGCCYGITRLIWRLHHIISVSETPKLSGELCAIRTACLEEIPENTATDEPYIESEIRRQHKKILYAPETIVHIRCPTKIPDIIKQRKRIWIGHMQLQNATGYEVSTSSFGNIMRAAANLKPRELVYALPGSLLEIIAYFQAKIGFSKGTIPFIWEQIRSTKT
jgi:biofilm PGA synthesis N-glycosyltransferase PgaC